MQALTAWAGGENAVEEVLGRDASLLINDDGLPRSVLGLERVAFARQQQTFIYLIVPTNYMSRPSAIPFECRFSVAFSNLRQASRIGSILAV
jgi:hypothetical protein